MSLRSLLKGGKKKVGVSKLILMFYGLGVERGGNGEMQRGIWAG